MSRLIKPRWKAKEEFNRLKMRLKLKNNQNVAQYLENCGKLESTLEESTNDIPYIERQDAMKILSNRLSLSCAKNTNLQCGFEMSDDEILNTVKKFLDYLESSGKTFKSVNSFTIDFMQKILEKIRDLSSPCQIPPEIFEKSMIGSELKEFVAELKRDVEQIKIDVFDIVDQFIRYSKHIKVRNWISKVTIGQMRRILIKVPDELKYGYDDDNNNNDNIIANTEIDVVRDEEEELKIKYYKMKMRTEPKKKKKVIKKSKDEIADINRKRLIVWKVNFQPTGMIQQPKPKKEVKKTKLEKMEKVPELDYYPLEVKNEVIEKLEEVKKVHHPSNIPIIMPRLRPNCCTNNQMRNMRVPIFVPTTALSRFEMCAKNETLRKLIEQHRNRQIFSLHLQACQFPISDISLYSQKDIDRNVQNLPDDYRQALECKLGAMKSF